VRLWGTGCGGMVTTDGCSMRCVKDNYPSIFIRHVLLGDSSETKDLDVFFIKLIPTRTSLPKRVVFNNAVGMLRVRCGG
jgi:hypothetical protein